MAKRPAPRRSKEAAEPSWDDVVNLIQQSGEVSRLRGAIREIIDSEPIDVPKLEIALREAISAVDKAHCERRWCSNRTVEKGRR